MTRPPQSFGLVGRSGSGKTTLAVRLIPELKSRGYRVSTVKHTHHAVDIDRPGKDSYAHREAGAEEVMIASAKRWALMHELRGEEEPKMDALVAIMTPVDLILIEGFKNHAYPKLEVYRPTLGKSPLYKTDPAIIAVAGDEKPDDLSRPYLDLNDTATIADFILDTVGLEKKKESS